MDGEIITTPIPASSDISNDAIVMLIKMLSQAVLDKNYMVVAGILLTLVGWFIRSYVIPKIKDGKYKEYITLINLVLSIIIGFAAWLLNPKLDFTQVMVTSVSATVIASGGWEVFMKPASKIFGKIKSRSKILKEFKNKTVEEKKTQ